MDVNQLRTLIQVAESGSLSKAADRLCIAQPALSRRIGHLEEELGVKLFERHGRGMVLTPQGTLTLDFSKQIMGLLEEIKTTLADEIFRGNVSIGFPPTVAEVLVLPLLEALSKNLPGVTARISSAYSLELLEMVHRGDLDVAILYDPSSIVSLKSTPFMDEPFYVVAPRGAGLEKNIPQSFAALQEKSFVLPSSRHSLRQIVDNAAEQHGFKMSVRVEAESFSVLSKLVKNGYGWTILPPAAIFHDLSAGELCAAPLKNPALSRRLELCFPSERPTSRLATLVGQTILNVIGEMVHDHQWEGATLLNQ